MLHTCWQIQMLGSLRVHNETRTIERFRTHKTGALLAYLALYADRTHPREILADLFWSDSPPEAARTNLRVALNSLRRQLETSGVATGSVLWASSEHVQLRPETITTDVAQFAASLHQAAQTSERPIKKRHLRHAIGLYRGRLLPHIYDDWALKASERFADQYRMALSHLSEIYETEGNFEKALDLAARCVEADPSDDDARARMIRLHPAPGRSSVDSDHYWSSERMLRATFDEKPGAAARALRDIVEQRADNLNRAAVGSAILPRSEHDDDPLLCERPVNWREPPELADSPAVRIPVPLNRFFGRQSELRQIERMLSADGSRLITLTGPGGSGKTRLAVEAARRAQDAFTGVYFVPLAECSRSDSVPDAVASVLGLSQSTYTDLMEGFRRRLVSGRTLLILDNFEHLLLEEEALPSSAAFVQALLSLTSDVTCLVTSRCRLCLSGEHELVIPPLQVSEAAPTDPAASPAGTILDPRSPAIALFVDRAQAARADFQLTPRNSDSIAALCHRLDGMPLAIELAAGWAQSLTPEQMLSQVSKLGSGRAAILVSRDRNVAPRHRSLQAAISWSFASLSPALSQLLRRLTVFHNGWTIEAAASVCFDDEEETHPAPEQGCLHLLTALRERNLINTEESSLGTETYLRFRMLETVREYAGEQLRDDERALTSDRHADYFLSLAETAEREMRTHDAALWQRRLDEEIENLRRAVAHFLAEGRAGAEKAARLASALARHWASLNQQAIFSEVYSWLAQIERADVSPSAWARVLLARSLVVMDRVTHSERTAMWDQSVELFREIGDEQGAAMALAEVRQSGMPFRPFLERTPLLRESLQVLEQAGDKRRIARVLLSLAQDDPGLSDADSLRYFDRSSVLFEECGDLDGKALALQERAWNQLGQGDYSGAGETLIEALALQEREGFRERRALSLWTLGKTLTALGRPAEARAAYTECVRLHELLGTPGICAASDLGNLCAGSGDLAEARFWFEYEPDLRGLCIVLICQEDFVTARWRCREYLESALMTVRAEENVGSPGDGTWLVPTRWNVQSAYHFLALIDAAAGDAAGSVSNLRSASAAAAAAPMRKETDRAASANRILFVMARLALLDKDVPMAAQLNAASLAAAADAYLTHIPDHERRYQEAVIARVRTSSDAAEWRTGWEAGLSAPWRRTLEDANKSFLS